MNEQQQDRLHHLLLTLVRERPDGEQLAIPAAPDAQFRLYRALVNMRWPDPMDEAYLTLEETFLRELNQERGIVSLPDGPEVTLWRGDITRLRVDAIVNAANSQMLGCFHPLHSCIDNCIHTYAGMRLRLRCQELMQGREALPGQAMVTPGFALPAAHVLHTVGPIVDGALTARDESLLVSCYRACMDAAAENGCRSLAFCCISTGVFRFPPDRAAELAVETVAHYRPAGLRVVFDVFSEADEARYRALLPGSV